MESLTPYQALKRMRELTRVGIPFSITFIAYNSTGKYSDGIKVVDNALLRTGLSRDRSDKAELLIGYTVEPSSEPRWFYLPLLLEFNGIPIKP